MTPVHTRVERDGRKRTIVLANVTAKNRRASIDVIVDKSGTLMTDEHLQRYCDEFDFRWVHRKVSDVERTKAALGQVRRKRLIYKYPI